MAMVEIDSVLPRVLPSADNRPDETEWTAPVSVLEGFKLVLHNKSLQSPIPLNRMVFDAHSHIGLRPSQEDRFVLIPEYFSKSVSLAAVFDGTVGHHASDYLSKHFPSYLTASPAMQEVLHSTVYSDQTKQTLPMEVVAARIKQAMREAFLCADQGLLKVCAEQSLHYASSTGVAAVVWKNLLTIAHVGDSKACIAKVTHDGRVVPEWLTIDHKPDMPQELARIQQCGGSLVWLHGSKPYIRGADFVRRQANGEHPKQLNYSRAFGGKDLKKYGLSAEPDINHFEVDVDDRVVLLASDGLWDVLSPQLACQIALAARKDGLCPSQAVVDYAIREMPRVGVRDNVTVLAIFLNE